MEQEGKPVLTTPSEFIPGLRFVQMQSSKQHDSPPFSLLGIDIGQTSPSFQFLCCASGVFCFLLVYGYLQEKIVVDRFDRRFGMVLTFLQFGAYTFLSLIFRVVRGDSGRKIPIKCYTRLALLQCCVQVLTNLSMKYLNYPARVMLTSSEVVTTIAIGTFVQGKQYPMKDWVVVVLLLIGLATFINAEIITSPEFDVRGVFLILIALACSAVVLNTQDHLLKTYNAPQDELIFFSFLGSSFLMFFITLYSGECFQAAAYISKNGGPKVIFEVFMLSCAGYLGLSCITTITKHFGALVSSITTTSRKAISLMLSFLFFPKPVVYQHMVGAFFFFAGLLMKACDKQTATEPQRKQKDLSIKPFHQQCLGNTEHGVSFEKRTSEALAS